MADEYRPPDLLREVREARAARTTSEMAIEFPPSLLYFRAEEAAGDGAVTRALYAHAMVEAGFLLTAPQDRGGVPYPVCPICGFVFE